MTLSKRRTGNEGNEGVHRGLARAPSLGSSGRDTGDAAKHGVSVARVFRVGRHALQSLPTSLCAPGHPPALWEVHQQEVGREGDTHLPAARSRSPPPPAGWSLTGGHSSSQQAAPQLPLGCCSLSICPILPLALQAQCSWYWGTVPLTCLDLRTE